MRKYFILSISLLVGSALQAQDLFRYGSSYSSAGIGELIDYRSSYAEGMGVTGIAAFSSISPGTANPAFLGGITLTSAGSNVQFRTFNINAGGATAINNQLQVNSFQLLLPVIKNKFGISVSLLPLTERSYKVERINLRAVNDPSVQFDMSEFGEGNLNRLELGFGYAVSQNLYVGYAPGFIFGSLTRQSVIDFFSSTLSGSQQVYNNSHFGFSNRFGLAYRLLKTKDQNYRVMAGLVVELPIKLNVNRTLDDYYLQGVSSGGGYAYKSTALADAESTMPASIGFGFSYQASTSLMLTSESIYQSWNSFSYTDNATNVSYVDRIRLGGGMQLSPSSRLSRAKWRLLKYRSGLVFDSGNTEISGNRISTLSVTGGISFPSPLSGSTIDINGSFGKRGTTSSGLVSESVFSVRVALNLSEFMFFRRYIQ